MVSISQLPKYVSIHRKRQCVEYVWRAPRAAIVAGYLPTFALLLTAKSKPTRDQAEYVVAHAERLTQEVVGFLGGPKSSVAKAKAALAAERERQYAAARPKAVPKSKLPIITQVQLREHFHYDPETGIFIWVKASGVHVKAGEVAGFKHPITGYIIIGFKRRMYLAHRLAWFYMTGKWPNGVVDHRNRVRDDNAWGNLRDVTQTENMANAGPTQYPPDPWRRAAIRARRAAKNALTNVSDAP